MSEITQPDAAEDNPEGIITNDPSGDEQPDADETVDHEDDEPEADEDHTAKLADAEARADKYGRALFTAQVAATGRLADPADLPYNAELVDDADALTAAIDALVEAKPHLRSRKPVGDVGQGQTKATTNGPVDLFARARSLM